MNSITLTQFNSKFVIRSLDYCFPEREYNDNENKNVTYQWEKTVIDEQPNIVKKAMVNYIEKNWKKE